MKRFAPVLAALLAVLTLAGCSLFTSKAMKSWEEAQELLNALNYGEAIPVLDEVIEYADEEVPEEAVAKIDALYLRGDAYLILGYKENAQESYDLALQEDLEARDFDRDIPATRYLRRGLIYRDREDYESALVCFQKGLSCSEILCEQDLRYNEILCLEKLGDFAGAKEKLSSYVADYPDDEEALKEYTFLESR